MKKSILLTLLCILIAQTTRAKLTVSKAGDGTVTLTLKAAGDLDAEFTGSYGTAKASDYLTNSGALTAAKIKVVTASGVKMTQQDLYRLYGEDYGRNQHFSLTELDLSNATLNSDNDLKGLAWITSMKKVTYPASTTYIPTTFSSSSKCQIEEVVIPDNAGISLTMDQQAFHTTSLKKITIGARNTISIKDLCFQGDTNLTTVDFRYGSTNIVIGNQAFDGCKALASIVLPEGVTEIGNGAFLNSGVTSIRLPNSLKYIRQKAFAGCSELKSITIPEGVEQIETTAFENNYNLSDVYVLGTATKCAEGAFTDNNTYRYTVSSYTDGQTGVTKNIYKPEDKNMKVVTQLHFKKAAYDNYANEYTKVIGTDRYNSSEYSGHRELNHWVFDDKGNKLPVRHSSYFEGTQGDYAGWKNFMMADSTLDNQIHTDETRIRDKWYTMCLPFDMTEEQLKSAYGATVEVVEFSGVTSEKKGNEKYITLHFNTPVTETKAHHPYMIHPAIHAGNKTGIKNTIVGIEKKPENDTNLQSQKVTQTCDGITYTFIGNYAKDKRLQQYSYYYYSGDDETKWPNAFYKRTDATGSTWTPYFACVLTSADDGARAKAGTQYFTEAIDHTTTAIAVPSTAGNTMHATNGKVFSINGQLVRTGSTSLEGLPKGIYIVNGKKQMVR